MKLKIKSTALLLLAMVFAIAIQAQNATGKITGKIVNDKNEPLSGVSIKVAGAAGGVQSGADGNYTLTLSVGTKHTVVFSYTGYADKEITDVEVKAGALVTLDVLLEFKKSTGLGDVVVKAQKRTARMESVNALIQFQKNTNTVASVVSAEAIRRSPDRNTGEVLKRTPGASLLDGKFLVVRGLADRYNQAMLNGILLTSTEPDRKTFSFDIIPSSMIDNIIINKAFVPEMPGEWAGGLIQVNTKDIPSQNFFNVQVGTGFNTQTVGKDFYKQKAGGLDWLGIDNGYRNIPAPYTTKNQFTLMTQAEKNEVGKAMNNDFGATAGNVSPNVSFQANGGFVGKLFGKKIGATVGVNYNRSYRLVRMLNRFNTVTAVGEFETTPNYDYNDDRYNQETTLGGLASFTMQLNNRNKVSLKSIVNVNTNSYTINRSGTNTTIGGGVDLYGGENTFRQNTFFTTQLTGEHTIANPLKLKWYGSFNILDGYSPDQRRYIYSRDIGTNNPYTLMIGNTITPETGSRLFQTLSDYIYTAGGDLAYNFDLFGKKQTVKGGYMLQVKDRLFNASLFANYIQGDNTTLRQQPIETVFSPENYGVTNGTFGFNAIVNTDMRYMGNTILNAGFIQFDNEFTDKLRVVWGVRAENYDQLIGSVKKWSNKHNHTEQFDLLPGLNATYKVNAKTNLRLSGSQTVIRPEMRELVGLALYDFELNSTVTGSPLLQRTKVTNLDLRYELYPRAGEALTAGVFYKYFQNPIEQTMAQGGAMFTYQNIEKASSYGVELEWRKKLDFIGALKNFTFQANGAYIYSKVEDFKLNVDRPMQGQSPYLVNLSLMYDQEDKGFNSTLLFNQIGQRIYIVGDTHLGGAIPDIWEASRPVLDWQVTQKILKKKAEIRLNVSDILNQRLYFYQNKNNDKTSFQKGDDAYRFTRKYGTTFSLSFSYNL